MNDDDVFYRISMNMNVDPAEIAKIVHDYLERGIVSDYDRFNNPPPPIYIGPVKVETLKERLDNYKKHKHIKEDNEMKATSVQNIKNVKNICFSIENHPAEMESKLVIVASTDDDIFAFEFEGPELLQICKGAGLFTGWEKDQKIKELEKELSCWRKRKFTNEELSDNVNHPSHYTGKYECIDVMQDVFGDEATDNFCLCNAFKYIWRARKKNGLEDVKKAIWYLNKYLELTEKEV